MSMLLGQVKRVTPGGRVARPGARPGARRRRVIRRGGALVTQLLDAAGRVISERPGRVGVGGRRRRRKGISGTELRGWSKVNRLIQNAVMLLPRAPRARIAGPGRRRTLFSRKRVGDGE